MRLYVEELIFKWQERTIILESRKLLAWLSAHPKGPPATLPAHDLLGMRNLTMQETAQKGSVLCTYGSSISIFICANSA